MAPNSLFYYPNINRYTKEMHMAKILLVEDDNLVRDMLVQMLQRAQHQVESAANGEEATEILKKMQPDIMVTDIIMPKKSGITLISEVRNKHPHMKIIA